MTRVLANGVFDILHPGHLHYLEESAALGDELFVVVTPDAMTEKDTVFTETERVRLVDALACVNEAFCGAEGEDHVVDTVERVEPDVITLGYDQDFDEDALEKRLQEQGFAVEVQRINALPGKTISSTAIRNRIHRQE